MLLLVLVALPLLVPPDPDDADAARIMFHTHATPAGFPPDVLRKMEADHAPGVPHDRLRWVWYHGTSDTNPSDLVFYRGRIMTKGQYAARLATGYENENDEKRIASCVKDPAARELLSRIVGGSRKVRKA